MAWASEVDPNVTDGRFAPPSEGSLALSDAYLQADQRGGTGSNGKPSLTIEEAAVQLTRHETSWGNYWGQAVTVNYAYRSTAPSRMPDDTSGFSRFSAQQIQATELALQAWSDVANITFARVGSGTSGSTAYSNSAAMLFGNYSSGSDGAAAFAYYPYSRSYGAVDGDVWVNNSLGYNANPQLFNYGHLVLVHEIGHAIGIAHPANYNAGDGQTITYSKHATYYEDSMQYTVMSYFYETYTGASYGSPYPATIMLDDIAAAQRLYGFNMSTRTGDTVYGFNSNAGRPWFSATSASSPLIFAVWDAGGVDTFDFSGYASAAKIDLRQGFFSDVGGMTGNVAIALNVVIENAIGGAGADAITGNSSANRLQGNGGNDTLTGLQGADVFVFTKGGGADIVTDFTIGLDKLDVSAFGSYISIAQSGADALVTFDASTSVRLKNISVSNLTDASFIGLTSAPPPPSPPEAGSGVTVNGTAAADTLYGGAGDDFLYGHAGKDKLDGKAGADVMHGGADNDTYYVDNIGDQVVEAAGAGIDTVISTVSFTLGDNVENLTLKGSALTATGNALANKLTGNGAANTLIGGAGADTLNGLGGADVMSGGADNDTYYVDHAGDQVIEHAGEGKDRVISTISYTLTANVENLTLKGSAAINGTGNALANIIVGNAAANILTGGGGNDTLTGGEGADIFVFTLGGGADTVTDFTLGVDRLDVTAFGGYTAIAQSGANTVVTLASGVKVTLRDVTATDLTAASFIGLKAASAPAARAIEGTSGADYLRGGAADEVLYGYDGADRLDGGGGADVMYGGAGDDTYYVDDAGDVVVERADEGRDVVHSTVSFTLGAHLEVLKLQGDGAIDGAGNDDNNVIKGNAADNRLQGNGGADTLSGGAGADTFVYRALSDSTPTASDRITDFDPLVDRIDLSAIDANTLVAGDQAFVWADAFTGAAGEAVASYKAGGNTTTIVFDVDGDGMADFRLLITGNVMGGDGFIL